MNPISKRCVMSKVVDSCRLCATRSSGVQHCYILMDDYLYVNSHPTITLFAYKLRSAHVIMLIPKYSA